MIRVSCLKMMNKCCKKYSCSNWNTTAIIHRCLWNAVIKLRSWVWFFINEAMSDRCYSYITSPPRMDQMSEGKIRGKKYEILLWFSKWRLEYYEPRNQIVYVTNRFCLFLPLIECYAMEGQHRHWNDEYWLHVQPKWLHFSNHLNNVQI